ncbi:MAG: hypothetical protein QXL78_05540 [Methanocellales archaeon]
MAGKKEMSIQDLKEYIDEKFEELQEELTEVKAEIAEKRKKPKEETFEESLRKFKEGAISLAAFTYTIADEILRNVEKTAKESFEKKGKEARERLAAELEEIARKLRK